MIVCHCAVVTDQDVLESLANGSRCLADVCRDTGAGRSCGGCVDTLRALVGRPAAEQPGELEMSRAAR
jgi:NAD(P)H-nitrite reductase large subunit